MNQDLDAFLESLNRRIEELTNGNNLSNNYDPLNIVELPEIPSEEKDYSFDDCLMKLNDMVGLDEIKTKIKKLTDYLIFVKKTQGIVKLDKVNLNMIFRGNPGTGKTTVARIVANILCKLGFLKTNSVLETTPRDFIAGYVGQTAIKARKTIDSAKGGVIFIDEAYAFSDSLDEKNHSFAPEAIAEIIKEMETKNTVFIFAGYTKKMDDFIDLNPGIRSRIGCDIVFKDYSKEELMIMFNNKVINSGLRLSDEAKIAIKTRIEEYMTKKNFGNGRMIDNLFDELIIEHASVNKDQNDKDKLVLITEESVNRIKIKSERGMSYG